MKISILVVCVLFMAECFAWGPIGHRVVGQIAQNHLTTKTKNELKKILGEETLWEVSTWADFIRSDKAWDKSHPWHYVSIADNSTYDKSQKFEKGDVIECIERLKKTLTDKKASFDEKKIALKFLVHFVGDVHQPLHVGRLDDKGGNSVSVMWFKEHTNLHSIWDSSMIDSQLLSFSEYASWVDHATRLEIEKWQNENAEVWMKEAMDLRPQVYDIGDGKLGFDYSFKNIKIVNERLLKGGIRLAGILNSLLK